MKLVNYRCDKCGEDEEELFNDTEKQPDKLDTTCKKCGGELVKWNFKRNEHSWRWNDNAL